MVAERLVLTVPEAAQALGLGRNQGYEAIRRGEIPVLRIGRRILVPREAIDRMIRTVATDAGSKTGEDDDRDVG